MPRLPESLKVPLPLLQQPPVHAEAKTRFIVVQLVRDAVNVLRLVCLTTNRMCVLVPHELL